MSACVCHYGAGAKFPLLRTNLADSSQSFGRPTDAEASVLGLHSDSAARGSRQATFDVKGEDGQAD